MVIVRVGTLVKELKEKVQHLERGLNDVINDAHRRIDDEVRMLQSNINENERDILSLLDSRLDKLASKINKQQLPKG